jgi:hypothetical protein
MGCLHQKAKEGVFSASTGKALQIRTAAHMIVGYI